MTDFASHLDKIQKLTKAKEYDQAWRSANEALIDLATQKDDLWFMMYYQMAIILAREKKWSNALEKMGYMIHFAGSLGGITHKKFVLRLLKKFKKEHRVKDYLDLAIEKRPEEFGSALKSFLKLRP